MRFKMVIITVIIFISFAVIPAYSQVQSIQDIETPTPQFQDHGGVTPWFWIGLQTVFSAGYNFETTAGGFRNYGGDNSTYASFNLAFVDSRYQTPKFYEVPREIDPDAWTGHFAMFNFTTRANSWEAGNAAWENNCPAWLAEITGKGARIGFFTQAANPVGGLFDLGGSGSNENNRKPITKISGGNKVLNLKEGQLGRVYYEKDSDSDMVTTYRTNSSAREGGAIMYTGYDKKDLWNVYLTMLSEGNVNSDVSGDKNKGFAGVVDFGLTPLGLYAEEETPFTLNVSGNVITGFGWKNVGSDTKNLGFGLKGEAGVWLLDNFVLSPLLALDAKYDSHNEFFWKMGGGLTFRFSGMRWTSDEWGDLYNSGYSWNTNSWAGNSNFVNYQYENNKILKYAYAQVYGAYSESSDFNLLFKAEEPDGNIGFHDKLGAMLEMRLYNLTNKNDKDMKWEAQARVSWDFNIKKYLITPYLRGYVNDDTVVKLRLGAYANFIPFTGFELAYTSANLNKGVDLPKPAYMSNPSYKNSFFDAGRIELMVILKSDEIRPIVPKRMSDWNYPSAIQDY